MFVAKNKIPWLVLFVVLLVVFVSGWGIYNFRFEKDFSWIKLQSKQEINLVSSLIKDRFQKREYQQAKNYISNWIKSSPDIVYLSLIGSNNYEFFKFENTKSSKNILVDKNLISYSYEGEATLIVHKSIDLFYVDQHQYLYQLLLFYVFVSTVFSSLVYSNQRIKKQKKHLRHEITERKKLEQELQEFNETLEIKVKNRTAELRALNEKVATIARSAGMAEVASGVLHNIGNVLNSVNVSVSLLREQMRSTKSKNLERVVEMLNDNHKDLAGFLSNDEKGKQIPEFLSALSKQLIKESDLVFLEVDDLSKNIEHIKNIISVQQSYAGSYGIKEKILMHELVDDALKITELGEEGDLIRVEKNYSDTPVLNLDKHKVLQIFINLMSNAKHALIDGTQLNKKLLITIYIEAGEINVAVQDNGIGIDKDDLSQLFNYGFTKRIDGHGFGLHNCALVANELGGTITVFSDGLGEGACFVFKMPMSTASDTNIESH